MLLLEGFFSKEMAETRSKSKSKGTEGAGIEDAKDNFISTLSRKYKTRTRCNDSVIEQYFPYAKKSKGLKHVTNLSEPLPLRAYSNDIPVTGGKENTFGTNMDCEENPNDIECSEEEKGLDSTHHQTQNVIDNHHMGEMFHNGNSNGINALHEDLCKIKASNDEELLVLSPMKDEVVEDAFKITEKPQDCLPSLEEKGKLTMQTVRLDRQEEYVLLDSSQPSSSGQNKAPATNEKSVCTCSHKLSKSHGKLIKISEELKNISNIVEKIKGELEKYS